VKIDHHLHTSRHSPDSSIDPEQLVKRAVAIGLDALVITEHDYLWDAEELAELSARAGSLKVFSGAEISAIEGHFLVYGLPSLDETPPGISFGDLLAVVRRHQGAIVAAHPFRWDQPFGALIGRYGPVFDGLELVSSNVTRETRAKTEYLLRFQPSMGMTGSSDAHEIDVVGCYYSEFPRRIETIDEFVLALRRKQGRPRYRPCPHLTSGAVGDEPA
jgi:predicted metal-dependent phosphoesterase TrpH